MLAVGCDHHDRRSFAGGEIVGPRAYRREKYCYQGKDERFAATPSDDEVRLAVAIRVGTVPARAFLKYTELVRIETQAEQSRKEDPPC
ncbi:hypothetical protein [Bradyrhizobium sp. RDT46]|uniref:hypothetical protein n=1 Tax=Bradyrhizobium sp. RDT46 TaxID=3341829 RepID=UPI0035C72238